MPEALPTILRKPAVAVSAQTQSAAVARMRLLAEFPVVVNRQLTSCKQRIGKLCDALMPVTEASSPGESGPPEPPDSAILRRLAGVGTIVLGLLIGEAWWGIKARDYNAFRSLCGIAPITRKGCKSKAVVMRQPCRPGLRDPGYDSSRLAVQWDQVDRANHSALRARGHSHGRALRSLAGRLSNVACAMLRSPTLYDTATRKVALAVARK